MSLLLTGTWEHALLATVAKEAASVAGEQGGTLGRTAMQKIAYFLQVLDVPMRYRFDVHHFGPFCSSILSDLEWLTADEVVVDSSPNPAKSSRYVPGPNFDELLSKHQSKLQQFEPIIKNTVEALLPLSTEHLELIATLHYAFRDKKATLATKPPKEAVIERFREFKKDKFPESRIVETYDRLDHAGLFE